MKAIWNMTEEQAIGNLTRQFVHKDPRLQSRMNFNALAASGAVSTAWYRGHHAGVYDAYLTLVPYHPRVAKALLKAFSIREDGAMG